MRFQLATNFCSGTDLKKRRIQRQVGGKEIEILTTRDGVTGDALPSESTAHSAREVVETSLAGTVGIGFVVQYPDSFNRTNLTNQINDFIEGRYIPPTLMIRAGSR